MGHHPVRNGLPQTNFTIGKRKVSVNKNRDKNIFLIQRLQESLLQSPPRIVGIVGDHMTEPADGR